MAAAVLLVALHLVVLHRIDGGDVSINADQITSLRSTEGVRDRLPQGHCVVGLVDGKFVVVRETCPEVRQQLEKAVPP